MSCVERGDLSRTPFRNRRACIGEKKREVRARVVVSDAPDERGPFLAIAHALTTRYKGDRKAGFTAGANVRASPA